MSYLQRQFPLDDPATSSLFDEVSVWCSRFGHLLLDHVPLEKGMSVLDVGCGTGFPLFELAHRLDPGSKITGIDTWKTALERAQWKKEKFGLNNVELVLADAAKMPFKDKEFSLITINLGINNFENPAKVISECYRVLQRSGKICLTTNLEGHFMEFYTVFENLLREMGREDLLPKLKEQEQHRGNLESVRELLEDARFSVLKMLKDRFVMRFVNGTALFNHFLTVIGFLPGWRSILSPDEEAAVFSQLEKKLNEQADWDGELKLTVPMLYVEAVK